MAQDAVQPEPGQNLHLVGRVRENGDFQAGTLFQGGFQLFGERQ